MLQNPSIYPFQLLNIVEPRRRNEVEHSFWAFGLLVGDSVVGIVLVFTSKLCYKILWLEDRLVGKLKETIYEDDDIGVVLIDAI